MSGQSKQSWEKYNLRALLRDAMHANPRASEKEISDAVWEAVKNERGYLRPLFLYWFGNAFRSFYVQEISEHDVAVLSHPVRRSPNPITRDEIVSAKQKMRTVLMDHVISSGKLLRFATFAEIKREAGWLESVSRAGTGNEIVGKKLSESDLWRIRARFESEAMAT